jgi:hypothetical protein
MQEPAAAIFSLLNLLAHIQLLRRFWSQIDPQVNICHIFFIRIMNNFGLLFEYSNNIRIFILLNKLPIQIG